MFDTLFRPVRTLLSACSLPTETSSPPRPIVPTLRFRVAVVVAVTAVVAGSTGVFQPEEVSAQECGHCHSLPDKRHWAHRPLTPMSGWGRGHGWHFYSGYRTCFTTHGICVSVPSGPGEDMVDLDKLVDEVAKAVSDGDVRRLAEFAIHPSVRIMPVRMALQIIGCGNVVVGHVPVGSEVLTAVTSAVEES